MMSCYDLIKGEAHVQNCQASDWSGCIYLCGSHDQCLFRLTLIGQIWSYDQNNLPCSFLISTFSKYSLKRKTVT